MSSSDGNTMTCVRFRGGPAPPRSVGEDRNPGASIAAHLLRELPAHGIQVEGVEDVEYAHEIRCTLEGRTYEVMVSFDWTTGQWWEVFYAPSLSAFDKLRGRSESVTMRRLSTALHAALSRLPGMGEMRWFAEYADPADGPYAPTPDAVSTR
jgi:hypothetical protein